MSEELLRRILWQCEDNRAAIRAIHDTLESVCKRIDTMSETTSTIDQAVAALQAQVTQQTTVEASAVTLLQGLSQQLTAALAADNINPQDAPNIQAAIAQLQTSASSLSAAITANTPAAPSTTGTATAAPAAPATV
jgi:chaperonin cofactor prefoldin